MASGTIVKVAGPLVIAEGMRDANMFDVVRVGDTVKVWVEKVDRDRKKISLTMVQGK